MSAQQPVQTELLMRHHQLQSRLATLKIENEEVRVHMCLRGLEVASVSVSSQCAVMFSSADSDEDD